MQRYWCLTPLVLAMCSPALQAATDTTNLQQVEVLSTATRSEQPVDGVTSSVIVVSRDEIDTLGAQSLKDIIVSTPGLTVQYGTFPSASSASKSSVSIRGLGATGTLWLLDGRRLAGEVKNPYDMDRIPAAMIERIEVVKGPMSALYGADAVGGVINIITRRPTDDVQVDVDARIGANAEGDGTQRHANIAVRGSQGKLRYSAYASVSSTDPYTETENTKTALGGGRHAPSEIPAVPGFLNPNGPTGGNAFYLQADGSVKPKPLDPAKAASDAAAAQAAFTQFREQAQAKVQDSYATDVTYREESDVKTVGGRLEYGFTEDVTAGIELNWFDEEREGVYRGAFHPTGFIPPMGHKTNPIVGYDVNGNPISLFQKEKRLLGKIPAWDVPVRSRDENSRVDVSVDTRINVNDDLQLNARYYQSDYEKRNSTTMLHYADFGYPNEAKSSASGMNANVDIRAFETYGIWTPNETHLVTVGGEVRDEEREATVFSQSNDLDKRGVNYTAFYLQDEIRLEDGFNITLGARHDQYEQDDYVDALGQQRNGDDDSKSTFRIGMLKRINDSLNVHASYAQAYRVPDIRELFIQKQTPAGLQLGAQTIDPRFGKQAIDLKAEETDAFEVGVNGRIGASRYQVAAFVNDISNRIQQVSVDANGDNQDDYFTFNNVSDAVTKGVEASFATPITSQLDGRIFWTELQTENEVTGKDLEFNPERTVSLQLDWRQSDAMRLGANLTYTGEQFYIKNGQDQTADAYTLLNVNGSYRVNGTSWSIYGGIDNLLDESIDKRLGSSVGRFVYAGVKASL